MTVCWALLLSRPADLNRNQVNYNDVNHTYTMSTMSTLYILKESEQLTGLIQALEILRDKHEDYGGLRTAYNEALDRLRVVQSKVLSKEHREECSGCASIQHING